jgi:hypothetical protein
MRKLLDPGVTGRRVGIGHNSGHRPFRGGVRGQLFLTRSQLARRYGLSLRTIARWQADPESWLPAAYDFDGKPLFALAEIEAAENARRRPKER